MGKEMMILGIGALVVVGAGILFWDKICPVIGMCGLNEKIGGAVDFAGDQAGEIISGGPDDEEDGGDADAGTTVSAPPKGEQEVQAGCCVCRFDGNQVKCNSRIGGPWKRYATAMRSQDPDERMAISMRICNNKCKKNARKGERLASPSNYSVGYYAADAFAPSTNGRMSVG